MNGVPVCRTIGKGDPPVRFVRAGGPDLRHVDRATPLRFSLNAFSKPADMRQADEHEQLVSVISLVLVIISLA